MFFIRVSKQYGNDNTYKNTLNVYYEDIVKNPVQTIKNILEYCEIDYKKSINDNFISSIDESILEKYSNNDIKYNIVPNEWGLIVLFKNYLQNLDLSWDAAGIQKVMDLHIKEEFNTTLI